MEVARRLGEQLLDLRPGAGADEGVAAAAAVERLCVLEAGDGATGNQVWRAARAADRRAALFERLWPGRSAQGEVRQHDLPAGQADAWRQTSADLYSGPAEARLRLYRGCRTGEPERDAIPHQRPLQRRRRRELVV